MPEQPAFLTPILMPSAGSASSGLSDIRWLIRAAARSEIVRMSFIAFIRTAT